MVLFLRQDRRLGKKHFFLTALLWVLLSAAQLLAVWIRLGWGDGNEYLAVHWPAVLGTFFIYALVFYAGGMYEPPMQRRKVAFDFLPLTTAGVAAILTGLVFYAKPSAQIGRGIWGLAAVFTLVLAYVYRHIHFALIRRGRFRRRAVILCGNPGQLAAMEDLLGRANIPLYHVLGRVQTGGGDAVDAGYPESCPLLGKAERLEEVVRERNVDAVLVAGDGNWNRETLPALRRLRFDGVGILDYMALSETLLNEIPLSHIDEQWLMTSALNSNIVHVRHLKRAMDVAVSLAGLVPGLPLMGLAALLIKLTSKGPVIYRQVRVGRGNKPYVLYKLRTMRVDAESGGAVWAQSHDSRVTPVGKYLRNWRLDEIPQLFNILKGEMSLVGPRPERPEFTGKLAEHIPFYNERHLVQPGLTGWAQVCHPYGASVEAAARKLQYDLYYIKNMNLLLDIAILLRTFRTIFAGLVHEEDVKEAEKTEYFERTLGLREDDGNEKGEP